MNIFVKYLIVFFVSMVPLIELRGAVPIGTGLGLPWHLTLIVAIIGNCVPIPIILLFVKKVLTWMRGCRIGLFRKISNWLHEKAEKNRVKIDKYAAWGLFVFVAIPLPGTERSSLPCSICQRRRRCCRYSLVSFRLDSS